MKKLHNPAGHQYARVLCREDTNHFEILPDFSIRQICACSIFRDKRYMRLFLNQ